MGGETSIVINLAQQANLSTTYGMRDQDAPEGWYVYRTLKRTADRTQAPIKALLKAQGVSYKSFWAANTIVAQSADRDLVQSLAARPDVKVIESNKPSNWLETDQAASAEYSFDSVAMIESLAPANPEVVEPGVNQVKAPMSGPSGSTVRGSWSASRTPASAGPTTRSGLNTEGGTVLRGPQLQLVGRHPLRWGELHDPTPRRRAMTFPLAHIDWHRGR